MKFYITMHMPSRGAPKRGDEQGAAQSLVHQMIVGHAANSLEAFTEALQSADFVIVREFYKDNTSAASDLRDMGEIAINYRHIGKIKVYRENG